MTEEKKGKKRGRKPRDWEGLKQKWFVSGLPKNNFLRNHGINPFSGATHRNTKSWREDLLKTQKSITESRVAEEGRISPGDEKYATVSNVVPIERHEAGKQTGQKLDGVNREAQPSSWQLVQNWRQKQAAEDYRTTDVIRSHIKLILKNSLVKAVKLGPDGKVVLDEHGQPVTEMTTNLSPHDLRALAHANEALQRVQRLALGLSTENVGLPMPGDGQVESNEEDKEAIPVFEVEMNRNGKFVRSRPRRIK